MESIQQLGGQLSQLQNAQGAGGNVNGLARDLLGTAQSGSALGSDFTKSLLAAAKNANIEGGDLPQVTGSSIQIQRSSSVPSVGGLVERFVDSVNEKQSISKAETRKILTGESDNLHQAVIAGQEANIYFTLMVEVRNKLTEGYKELTRMQV